MTTTAKDNMALHLHRKFAIRTQGLYVAVDDKGNYYLTDDHSKAEARWDIRGALGIKDRYIQSVWNVTMGEKPVCEVIEVRRKQRIHHWW